MANAIQIKRRSSSGAAGKPDTSSLKWGELAFNEADNILYYGYGSGNDVCLSVEQIGGSGYFADRGGVNATGTWPISINGNAATVTNGVTYTGTPTAGYIPKFNDVDTIENGYQISSNLSTNNSSAYIPRADAVKTYVDSIKQGLDIKASVVAATLSNILVTDSTANSLDVDFGTFEGNILTIDGVTIEEGYRILVKSQTDSTQNGIYTVGILSLSGSNIVCTLDRTDDAKGIFLTEGAFTFVEQGISNGNTGWVLTTGESSINYGTTPITFSQFSSAGQIYDGSGLYKQGNIISVGTASESRIVVNADNIDLATVSRTDNTGAAVGISFPRFITTDSYGRLTAVSSGTIQSASTSQKGVAQFNSDNFDVTLGAVSLKNVVHTTGNQLVSGVKTFSSNVKTTSIDLTAASPYITFDNGAANIYAINANGELRLVNSLTNSGIALDADYVKVQAANTASSPTHFAVFSQDPNSSNRVLLSRASGDILADIGAASNTDTTIVRTTGDQTICGPKTFGGSDLDNYILNVETSANGSGIIAFSEPTLKMYLMFDGLNNDLKIKEFAGDDTHKFNITTYTKLRASGTSSAATQVPVFISDPTTTSQVLYYRTPAQLLSDAGSVASTRSLTAGSGLQGGGDLSADRTFDIKTGYGIDISSDSVVVDTSEVVVTTGTQTINGVKTFGNRPVLNSGLSAIVPATENGSVGYFAVFDSDPSSSSQVLKSVSKSSILDDIGAATSGLTLTAGSGLVGGGTLSSNITFDVNTGYGLTINSDQVIVNTTEVVVATGSQTINGAKTFGNTSIFNSGLNSIAANTSSVGYFAVFDSNPATSTQSLKSVSKSEVIDDIGAASSGLTLTAGSGLQGGGTLSENRTFDVITGDGIQISGDAVTVNSTVVRTTGNQTIGDAKTFNQVVVIPTGTSPGGRSTLRIGHGADYYYDFYSGVGSSASGYLLAGIHSDTSNAPFRVVINNNAGTSSITNATWDATTIAVNKGGTGQTTYTNGQLLIGNTTGNTLTKATLTEGTGIDITNGNGSITIAHEDTSTLSGAQGSNGIASISLDGFGHITGVTTATYLTSATICTAIANCGIDGGTF